MSLVSVIIPVYQAEQYLREAVLSAVNNPFVGEILLVEDGSRDNSFLICEKLIEEFPKVKLFTHFNHQNLGASESRNLGIKNASFDFVAFLDADDIYCDNRFDDAMRILKSNQKIDGVYSAVGYLNEPYGKVFTLSKKINPNKLFHFLLRGTYGHFHTNGILVKKKLFEKSGYFNPELALHQDSEMWLRLAFCGKLIRAELVKPVALIRRHEGNRIWLGKNDHTVLKSLSATLLWLENKKTSFIDQLILIKKISQLQSRIKSKSFNSIFLLNLFKFLFRKTKTIVS